MLVCLVGASEPAVAQRHHILCERFVRQGYDVGSHHGLPHSARFSESLCAPRAALPVRRTCSNGATPP